MRGGRRSGACINAMAAPRMSQRAQEIDKFKNTSSGVPIKIMTALLLGLTTWFAYDLHRRKRLPHQNGASLLDALPRMR